MTVTLDAAGLKPGDVAGLALFNRPYAWIGVERGDEGLTLAQFDEVSGKSRVAHPLKSARVWLRADCDFVKNIASFRYSTDGKTYAADRRASRHGLRSHHLSGRAQLAVLVSTRSPAPRAATRTSMPSR